MEKDDNIYYLAAPYSHPDRQVRAERAAAASRCAATLIKQGKTVISPLSMGHAINSADPSIPFDYESHRRLCESLMDSCTSIVILSLDGTYESNGVAAEIDYMQKQNKTIVILYPDGDLYNSLTLDKSLRINTTPTLSVEP